ncbi:hypothetical protein GPALN_006456 [Globodera pallida]|nr:hypothetical protein GPALN_006456 [Globodera pallida]
MTSAEESNEQLVQEIIGNVLSDTVKDEQQQEELQLLEDEEKLNAAGTVEVVDVGHHSFVQPADESNDYSMESVKEEQDTDESVQRIADKVEGISLKENIKEEDANTTPTEQDDKVSVNSNENKDALSSPPREVPSVVAVVTPLSANAQQQEDHQQHSEQIGSAAQNAETNRESAGDDTDALSSPPREVPPSTSAKDGVVGKGRPGCSAGTATKTEAKAKTKACSVL